MMKGSLKWLVAGCCAAAVVLVTGLSVGLRYYFDKKASCFDSEYVLYVYPDMTAQAVTDSLSAVAKRPGSIRRCAEAENLAERIKPGKYAIEPGFSAVYAVRMVANGWQTTHNLTLSGTIRTREKLAAAISRQMMMDSAAVMNALHDEELLAKFGFTPENVFAMFLPDTYQVYWTDSVESLFSRFKKEYDIFWTDERKQKAADLGLTPMEVSILASIVNGETLKVEDYPKIAGVYLNRLRKGIKLQACPTVCFCFDYKIDRVLKKHLQVDSPYNTYKHRGLPPAPISVPPKACIDAVLNPDEHGYLYFCASPEFDGTHRFAVTYREHLKNARDFQRALDARRKASGK